jgi:Tol biopolymer transport system component
MRWSTCNAAALQRSVLIKRHRLITLVGLLVLVASTSCRRKESIHSELIREHQRGFELVSVRNSALYSLSFDRRTLTQPAVFTNNSSQPYGAVSPDGKRIAIGLCSGGTGSSILNAYVCSGPSVLALVETGNKNIREFEGFDDPGTEMCWSHDSSKLALTMTDRRQGARGRFGLQIVDVKTGENRMIWEGPDSFAVAQCWSPDDKRIVFTTNKPGGIRITRVYDMESKQSSDLAGGGFPTWSPDGSRIAFLYCPPSLVDCKYYAIRAKDGQQELLFKPHFAESGLFWSPDSRFVAYIGGADILDSKPSSWFRESRRLRVRRLEDNAEEPFLYFFDGDVMWFNWVSRPVPLGV